MKILRKESLWIAIIAGIFTILATVISGVFDISSNRDSTPTLQLVDVLMRNNTFDIKVKNSSENEILIKEFEFVISEFRPAECGPLMPSHRYEIEGNFNENTGVVKSSSMADAHRRLGIKLSHMIKPRSVDRFEIKINVNEPKGNQCVNGAQVNGVVNIYYDQSGLLSYEMLSIWLSIENEFEIGKNRRKGASRKTYNQIAEDLYLQPHNNLHAAPHRGVSLRMMKPVHPSRNA